MNSIAQHSAQTAQTAVRNLIFEKTAEKSDGMSTEEVTCFNMEANLAIETTKKTTFFNNEILIHSTIIFLKYIYIYIGNST